MTISTGVRNGLILAGAAVVVGGGALLLTACGNDEVEGATWKGEEDRGFGKLTGSTDSGEGSWTAKIARRLDTDVNLNGTHAGNDNVTVTARDRFSGGYASMTATMPAEGAIMGAINGVRAVAYTDFEGDTHYTTQPFNAGVDGAALANGDWSVNLDIPWGRDWKASGHAGDDGWSLEIQRPGDFDLSFSGTGPMTQQQQLAVVAGYLING